MEYPHFIPPINAISLSDISVSLYVPPISWKGDPMGHIGISDVFFFVVSGKCFLDIDGETYILKEGELAFLPKGKKRTYTGLTNDFTLYEMRFSAQNKNGENLFKYINIGEGEPIRVPYERVKELLEKSVRYEVHKSGTYDLFAMSALLEILTVYITQRANNEFMQKPFSNTILFMKKNLDKKITLSMLSESAFMQPTYFIKKFKEAYSCPPMEYLAKLRIYKAMCLLAQNKKTDSVIKCIGISDSAYFSRFFKKHTGVSPLEYKKLFNVCR